MVISLLVFVSPSNVCLLLTSPNPLLLLLDLVLLTRPLVVSFFPLPGRPVFLVVSVSTSPSSVVPYVPSVLSVSFWTDMSGIPSLEPGPRH